MFNWYNFAAALIALLMLAILMLVIEKLFKPPEDVALIVRLIFLVAALCVALGIFSGHIVVWGH